jgi:hypothetical protein
MSITEEQKEAFRKKLEELYSEPAHSGEGTKFRIQEKKRVAIAAMEGIFEDKETNFRKTFYKRYGDSGVKLETALEYLRSFADTTSYLRIEGYQITLLTQNLPKALEDKKTEEKGKENDGVKKK